jgi:hypothetical protein
VGERATMGSVASRRSAACHRSSSSSGGGDAEQRNAASREFLLVACLVADCLSGGALVSSVCRLAPHGSPVSRPSWTACPRAAA